MKQQATKLASGRVHYDEGFHVSGLVESPLPLLDEHIAVTVGRDTDGTYRWKEQHGAPPAREHGPTSIIRILLVRAKDGPSHLHLRREGYRFDVAYTSVANYPTRTAP
jgi:hypothetical protein